jgi:hypothetical protein
MRASRRAMWEKPPKRYFSCGLALVAIVGSAAQPARAMGLRSFVALPVEKGGEVVRLQIERNESADRNIAAASLAHGLSGTQTLLLAVPYRLSPGGRDRWGDLSALYRHIVWQVDGANRTSRLGLLGGAVVPTDGDRDLALQAGAVATFYRGRYEWDLDVLYLRGQGARPDAGRYDVSWQYRLTPAEYPDWGLVPEWNMVIELGGRYTQGESTTHQITGGVQWIHRRWVLEGGITQDLSGPRDRSALLSFRWHLRN